MTATEGAVFQDTIAARLARHAGERPADPAFCFTGRHAAESRTVSWGELWMEAHRIAAGLAGLAGRPVVILCPDPRDFIPVLAGCLVAGAVAVPVPGIATRRAAGRIQSIIAAASPAALVAPSRALAQPWLTELLSTGRVAPLAVEALRSLEPRATFVPGAGGALALMQFTSGSTGKPRGVALSDLNLASNCQSIVDAYGLSAATRGFSWLPLHHDMGLVGHILAPLWIGCRSTIMDPLLFLQSPLRWLRRAGEERATITSAPNFAYQLCARAAADGDLEGIDLSSLTAAVCGGEPVWPETIRAFADAFGPFGFDEGAFAPSYGLAEATLLVSSGRRPGGPRLFSGAVRDDGATTGTTDVRAVLLGPPVESVAVRILDAAGNALPEDAIGEIEISGPSVGLPAGSGAADAHSPRALTGDLGFLHGGEIVVTGRRKELMILRGANVYPADAEAAASAADPAIGPAGVAAFGVVTDGTEEMVVAFEVHGGALDASAFEAIARRVNEAVGQATGHVPAAVIAVPHGTLPRTTSGKIRRHALGALCVGGGIDVLNTTDQNLLGTKGGEGG